MEMGRVVDPLLCECVCPDTLCVGFTIRNPECECTEVSEANAQCPIGQVFSYNKIIASVAVRPSNSAPHHKVLYLIVVLVGALQLVQHPLVS